MLKNPVLNANNNLIERRNWVKAINLLFLRSFGPVAQLNRASDYGSEGFRFES